MVFRVTCSRCGTVPLVTSEIGNQLYAVINVDVLENIDPSRLRRASTNFEDDLLVRTMVPAHRRFGSFVPRVQRISSEV